MFKFKMESIKIMIDSIDSWVILVGFKYCEYRQFSKLLFNNKSVQNIIGLWSNRPHFYSYWKPGWNSSDQYQCQTNLGW